VSLTCSLRLGPVAGTAAGPARGRIKTCVIGVSSFAIAWLALPPIRAERRHLGRDEQRWKRHR
jgi:hypothetical protein